MSDAWDEAFGLYQVGRLPEAQAACESILQRQADDARALHLLGIVVAKAQNLMRAIGLLDRAAGIAPDSAAIHLDRSRVLLALRQTPQCIASFERVIALDPGCAEAHFRLGQIHQSLGQLEVSASHYERTIALLPHLVDAHRNRAQVLYGLRRFDESLRSLERARDLQPQDADLRHNCGIVLMEMGQASAALAQFDQAIALSPDFAEPHSARGGALQALERFDAALESCNRAIALDHNLAQGHSNRGGALHGLGRNQDAVASYDKAIALDPSQAGVHYNRATALFDLGSLQEALAGYDHALKLMPGLAMAWSDRGVALQELGRTTEALASFAKAIALEPTLLGPRKGTFWHHWARASDLPGLEALSQQLLELRVREDMDALRGNGVMAGFVAQHDLEQTRYLLDRGYALDGLREASQIFADVSARAQDASSVALTREEIAVLTRYKANLVRYAPRTIPGGCLNDGVDWRDVEERYLQADPEIAWVDDFLTAEALSELHKFCLISPIWREHHANRYLGAFAEFGFLSPLHFQIASALQSRIPRILGGHALSQLWAFKYTSKLGSGINVHADFARVNLNFWITPDAANLDPQSGGMIVYHQACPSSWSYREYNKNEHGIYAFLKEAGARSTKIPYRCNRLVLFNSNLFHETDEFDFRAGYENRRINVTYLFGKGLRIT